MKLTELFFNRFLYKAPQSVETQDSTYLSGNQVPTDNPPISSGDTVFDINTNSQYINGANLNPNSPIPPGVLNISNWGWTQSCNFTVASLNTVTWSAGTFTSSDGSSYAIGAGTTGVMAAKTYIYLDILASPTAYLITTSLTAPVGIGKVLIAVAQNGPTSATYVLVQATQVVADNILANTITAQKMNVGQLSAITADLGSITAGTVTGALIRTSAGTTRVQMNYATNAFEAYYGGDLRGGFDGFSLFFLGPNEVAGGAIWSAGTNQVNIGTGANGFEFNESQFWSTDGQDIGDSNYPFGTGYFDAISLGGTTKYSWPTEFSGDWSDITIDSDKNFNTYDISGLGTVSSSSGNFSILSASSYLETNDIFAESGSTVTMNANLTCTGDLSVGSNDIRVGGYLYLNSGNNNAYIYSSGSHTYVAAGGGGTLDIYQTDKTAIVPTSEGFNALYCMESPEVWFMDFCDEKGKLSPMFEEVTVGPYHYIKCGGGEYQVWGRRKGHEHKRFEKKTKAEFDKNNEFYSMAKVT